jgi:DNA-binding SARP family transcriptional activator/predicted ATPase
MGAQHSGQKRLRIRLLGELTVLRDGTVEALPASKKARALLGYLVATGRSHLRERLCELLWDGPDDPRAALRWALAKLRPILSARGCERLVTDRDHVEFAPTAVEVDVAAVRALGDVDAASTEALEAAVSHFRGPFLDGLDLPGCVRFHAWCIAEREQLQSRHVTALKTLVDRLTDRPEAALAHARALLALDPFAEPAHLTVMRLLAELGRVREAVAAYEGFRRLLETELGTRPSAELERARMALSRPTPREPQADTSPRTIPAPAATITPPAPESRAASSLPLVGRTGERHTMDALLARARAGDGAELLLILGDPGVGKSRLMDELRASATTAPALVLFGRAFEAELARAYGAWVDALRGATSLLEKARRRADLASLLPELGAAAPDQDRTRLFDAVATTLRDLSGEALVVVMLDDLQWLDEASAALLHFLVRALIGARVLFAGTARAGELGDNQPVLKVVRALERERRVTSLTLGALDQVESAQLVRLVAPSLDATRIFDESEGNPLFALEMARALAAGETNPADTLSGLLADRLARFEGSTRTALSFAAAIGRSFDVEVLGRVTGLPPDPLLSNLELLERHGVLRAAGPTGYDFTHDLVRRAAYRQMSEPRRRFVHGQIARALAATPDPDGALHGDVAHHAALGGDHRLAAEACVSAGARCLRLFAYEQARELGQRGLPHAQRLPPRERLPVEIELLGLEVQALRGPRARLLEPELTRAAAESRAVGLSEAEARAHRFLSLAQYQSGDYARAEESSIRQVEAGRAGSRMEAATELAASARCLALLEREIPRAEALIEEASAAFGPDAQVMDVFWTRGLLRHFSGETEQAIRDLTRAAEVAARAELNWEQCYCLIRLAVLELERRRPAQALPWCERLATVASKMGDGYERPMAATLRALARRSLGPVGASEELARALEELRAADAKAALSTALNLCAEMALEAGEETSAQAWAHEALEAATTVQQHSQQAIARTLLARLAAAAGDRAAARDHLRAAAGDRAEPQTMSARARAALDRARAEVSGDGTAPIA